jgi:hypothetical protein
MHFVISVWFCSTLLYYNNEMDLNQEKWKTDWLVNNPTIVSICSQRVYTNRINNFTRIYWSALLQSTINYASRPAPLRGHTDLVLGKVYICSKVFHFMPYIDIFQIMINP